MDVQQQHLKAELLAHCLLKRPARAPSARACVCHSLSSPLLEPTGPGTGPKLDKQEPFAKKQLRKPHFPLGYGNFLGQLFPVEDILTGLCGSPDKGLAEVMDVAFFLPWIWKHCTFLGQIRTSEDNNWIPHAVVKLPGSSGWIRSASITN